MSTRAPLLRNRAFARLFAAQAISLLGSGATTVGLALFAYRLAGAESVTTVVGHALTLRILAFMLFSQPAGVLADRVSRKAILICSDLARAALLLFLPFATAAWHVYVLVFVLNALTAFFTPTFEATIPDIVGADDLVAALGLSRVAADVEALVAPAVAAALVAVVGVDWIFRFDALTYVASAVLVALVSFPPLGPDPKPLSLASFARDITHGARVILREASLRQAVVLSFAEATAGAGAIVVTVAYVRTTLGAGDTAVSLVMAAVGVGSSLVAVALGRVTGRYERGASDPAALHGRRHAWGQRALLLGGAAMSLALVPLVVSPGVVVVALLWALLGGGQALVAVPSSMLLAEHTSPSDRGRAYAAHFALTHAFWLVTYPGVGHAAAHWGAPLTLTAAGVTCLAITLFGAVARSTAGSHTHPAR